VRYNHILDPRTGWPVTGITSVTVIHEHGAVADAAATALVVVGKEDWHRIAEKMGIKYAMLVDEEGTVYMNPAMKERVQFQSGEEPRIEISDPLPVQH
jgi:thiamine biosynthesis lipoprotein